MFNSRMLRIAVMAPLAMLSALGLAQGTRGEGHLTNSANQSAHFRMWVTLNSMSPVAPFFQFTIPSTTSNVPGVQIEMRRLSSVVVNERMCEFTATAIMTRRRNGVATSTPGILRVRVLDLVPPGQVMNVADTMELTFTGATSTAQFQYSGWVQRGDILVWGR